MWKRMQQGKSAKHQSQPTSPDGNGFTPESTLDSMLPPQDNSYSNSQPSAQSRGLPALPDEYQEQPQARQGGKYRPASSVYSQHSPRYPPPTTFQEQVSSYEEQVEISPPSSPDIPRSEMAPQSYNTHPSDVPPPPPPHAVRPPRQESSIPVARREKRRNQAQATTAGHLARREEQAAAAAGLRRTSGTRWDDYSGEPNEQGRPPSVQPGQFTPVVTNLEDAYNKAQGAPKVQTSFTDRVRRLKEGNKNKLGGSKPEWKGSSGRMAIVPAPEDNLSAPPLQIPRKSSKRVPSNPSMSGGSRVTSPSSETPIVSPSAHGGPQYFNQALNTTSEVPEPPPHDGPTTPIDSLPSQRVQPRRPAPAHPATPEQSTLPPSVSTIERNFHQALKDVSISTP
ncbi:hypothetical protein V492_03447, partial [Pseudogymnoascus sp. VKM F-4246]